MIVHQCPRDAKRLVAEPVEPVVELHNRLRLREPHGFSHRVIGVVGAVPRIDDELVCPAVGDPTFGRGPSSVVCSDAVEQDLHHAGRCARASRAAFSISPSRPAERPVKPDEVALLDPQGRRNPEDVLRCDKPNCAPLGGGIVDTAVPAITPRATTALFSLAPGELIRHVGQDVEIASSINAGRTRDRPRQRVTRTRDRVHHLATLVDRLASRTVDPCLDTDTVTIGIRLTVGLQANGDRPEVAEQLAQAAHDRLGVRVFRVTDAFKMTIDLERLDRRRSGRGARVTGPIACRISLRRGAGLGLVQVPETLVDRNINLHVKVKWPHDNRIGSAACVSGAVRHRQCGSKRRASRGVWISVGYRQIPCVRDGGDRPNIAITKVPLITDGVGVSDNTLEGNGMAVVGFVRRKWIERNPGNGEHVGRFARRHCHWKLHSIRLTGTVLDGEGNQDIVRCRNRVVVHPCGPGVNNSMEPQWRRCRVKEPARRN